MTDHHAALENELARLPGVIFTRFVERGPERGLGATVFVSAGTDLAALTRNVGAVARAHFGVDLDGSRLVFAEIGQLTMVAPAGGAGSGVGAGEAPVAAGAGDAQGELEAAQQAVSEMLERLNSDANPPTGGPPG